MVLRVENGVRPEGLCDVFVKVGGEGEVGVEVVDEAAVVRLPQDEQHVVVPDDELLLVLARPLAPQRHHLLLVRHEHHRRLKARDMGQVLNDECEK